MRTNKPIEIDVAETGKKIKRLMEQQNISSKELSKIMQISLQAVYRWQRGEALPAINNLYVLGKLLSIDVDDIIVEKLK